MKYIIILSLLLTACGSEPKRVTGDIMRETEATNLQIDFRTTAAHYGLIPEYIPIEFIKGFQKLNVVGTCYYNLKKIMIDRDYWDSVDYVGKRILIYHELGHCALYKKHTNTTNDIMSEYLYRPQDQNELRLMIERLFL